MTKLARVSISKDLSYSIIYIFIYIYYKLFYFWGKITHLIYMNMKKYMEKSLSATPTTSCHSWSFPVVLPDIEKNLHICIFFPLLLKPSNLNFLSGTVDKNQPANAGDTGLISSPGRFHMRPSNSARGPQLLSRGTRAWEPQLLKPTYPEPMLHNKRSRCNEKPKDLN